MVNSLFKMNNFKIPKEIEWMNRMDEWMNEWNKWMN